jgi:hypothetical protein
MSLVSPQENRTAAPPAGENAPAPSAHEIKYQHDAANYVAAMVAELRQISGKAGFEKLVAALDSAYYEAYSLMGQRPKLGTGEAGEKNPQPVEPQGE